MMYLFVIASLKVGGVQSSLNSLYNKLKSRDNVTIKVLPLSSSGSFEADFAGQILPAPLLLSAYYGDFKALQGKTKVLALIIKLLKRAALILHFDFESIFDRIVARCIERKYNFDGIVAYAEGEPTKFCSFFKNPNKIAWIHCDYRYSMWAQNDYSRIYDKFRSVVCVSEYTTNSFREFYPSVKGKVCAIHNLLDAARVKQLSEKRIEDGILSNNGFNIISVGRVVELKQMSKIPEIVSILLNKGCSVNWYVLGPEADDVDNLLDNIKKYNVEQNVHYIGNQVNPYPFFKNSQLLVSLSRTEACPMIFCEAKILHLPVVTNNFGSAYEFIEDGKSGIICSIDMFPDVIEELYKNKKKYSELVNYKYDYELESEQIVEQITDLLLKKNN